MTTKYMRNSHWLVTLSVTPENGSGPVDHGTWKALEGGDVTAEATIVKPGGMQPAVAVPAGKGTTDTITLTKQFTQADAATEYAKLKAYVGSGSQAKTGQQPLDYSGTPFGTPLVDTGVVQSVSRPQADSESDDISSITLVIAPNGE